MTRVAGSQEVIVLNQGSVIIPVVTLNGILSPLANICIIFMVVFFGKLGFITSLTLLLFQFPMLIRSIFFMHNTSSAAGLFSNVFTIITVILIYRRNVTIERYQKNEVENLRAQRGFTERLFEQTATALVGAIDAKDEYSHGHSERVAEYAEKIAREAGMSDEECRRIYYAGLLHDVGKIGIADNIINKNGKLTPEEYEVIKQHPVMGNQILTSISEYPYLSIGAHFHHERYDGKGYPDRLKGDDIPEIARIISVADAYDAMTSNRSYRDAIPQQLVREEIVKGAGTQFDPEYAKIMQHLIDLDSEYKMRERTVAGNLAGRDELVCGIYRGEVSDGILLTQNMTGIHLKFKPEGTAPDGTVSRSPAIILFDSLDGRVHESEKLIRELAYFEYGEIWLDGHVSEKNVRRTQVLEFEKDAEKTRSRSRDKETVYDIEAVNINDHVLIRIDDSRKITEVTLALPDSSRYAYIGLTGEYCRISEIAVSRSEMPVSKDYISRIADPISYLNGPAGDIPNIQIDGSRSAATDGIAITDGMTVSFHTLSLPTARLIWHCPYIVIFSSDDKKVKGKNYREYALTRLDGENWDVDGFAENKLIVNRNDDFEGWDAWKKACKEGFDCVVSFGRAGNKISVTTENQGLYVKNTTTLPDGTGEVYAALTGDQVALTNIRIQGGNA
ncbi:MAG: HD-GYP domain-containing protein [Lachnospiraceae bacterium]|nr:HD-GYP domain-containing protein [Lachnospiraceae bacterium]